MEYRRGTALGQASAIVTVPNPLGLHFRPIAAFVDIAGRFRSNVRVRKGRLCVDGKSPLDMFLLDAPRGTQLEILAEGEDADAALAELVKLVNDGFGEMDLTHPGSTDESG